MQRAFWMSEDLNPTMEQLPDGGMVAYKDPTPAFRQEILAARGSQ